MEDKRIEAVKNWPEPGLLGFANCYQRFISFYRRFIQDLSKLAGPLTSILRTISTRLAENSPLSMDRAEDAEVGSGTSSTTRSAKNLSASVDMAKDAEVGESGGDDDKTVEKSPLFKKSSGPIGYFTSLHSDADSALLAKR